MSTPSSPPYSGSCHDILYQLGSVLRPFKQMLDVQLGASQGFFHHDALDGSVSYIERDRVPVDAENLVFELF
jgi:hypothetical protein